MFIVDVTSSTYTSAAIVYTFITTQEYSNTKAFPILNLEKLDN